MKKEKIKEVATIRTLIVEDNSKAGEFQIDIPSDAKVTFGPAFPGKQDDRAMYGQNKGVYALRVYKGPAESAGLYAVFTGVYAFRDVSIPVRKLVFRENGKTIWNSDDEGLSTSTDIKREKFYQDDSQLKRLPAATKTKK